LTVGGNIRVRVGCLAEDVVVSAIELMDLSKTFTVKRTRVEAVRKLSVAVDKGEVFGFLGPNGAGKTTTIKMLMGLIRPTGGNASVMGHDAGSHLGRLRVGYLPENPSFYDYLTATEYLSFVAKTFGMNGRQAHERSSEVLRLLDLWDARSRAIRGFSKGMVQRLGLAQTLIHDPDVFVLDEPMSGLDPVGRVLVKKIILDLKKRGKCVFFSTHITSDVEALCDRVGIILQGTLRKLDRIESIMSEGLMGYQIRFRKSGSQERIDSYVEKRDFTEFLKEITTSGSEIEIVEPRRKDLESYFLDVVRGATA
jgi:ABC-2 type transport system ATP-binding protein